MWLAHVFMLAFGYSLPHLKKNFNTSASSILEIVEEKAVSVVKIGRLATLKTFYLYIKLF